MLLAIDAGNTTTVFAIYDEGMVKGHWRLSTREERTSDEYAVWLSQLMQLSQIDSGQITRALLSSVVPLTTDPIRRLCREHFGCDLKVVGEPTIDLDIKAEINRPEDVGADRLVTSLAAKRLHEPPLIVIDFGTATTFDIVNEAGNFGGGVICPGVNLSMEALFSAAAKLPKVEVVAPDTVIGGSTITAMQSGVYWGYVGMVEGLVDRIRGELGAEATVIATGGLASLFTGATDRIDHVYEDLVMRGLLAIDALNS
ncbi:MAG: type III pantothenate kinase [Pseudomonadota bacterium]